MWIALYITIFLIFVACYPLGHTSYQITMGFLVPKEFVFLIGSLCTIGSSLFFGNGFAKRFQNKWFSAFFIYICLMFLLNFCWPMVASLSTGKIVWMATAMRPFMNMTAGMLLMVFLISMTKDYDIWVITAKVLCWIGFGFSVYAILQWLGLDQVFGNSDFEYTNKVLKRKYHMLTLLGSHVFTGLTLSVISPLFLMFNRLKYRIAYFVVILAIILTHNVTAYFASVAGLLIFLVLTKRRIILIGTFVLVVLGGAYFHNNVKSFSDLSGRKNLWVSVINKYFATDMIFTGIGFGSYYYVVDAPKQREDKGFEPGQLNTLWAHNEWLQLFIEGGVIGGVIVIGYFINLFIRIKDLLVSDPSVLTIGYLSVFLSFFVISLTFNPLHLAPLAMIFILTLSSLESQTIKRSAA